MGRALLILGIGITVVGFVGGAIAYDHMTWPSGLLWTVLFVAGMVAASLGERRMHRERRPKQEPLN